MNSILPGRKVTLLPFAHTDVGYFNKIFTGYNCLQLVNFAEITDLKVREMMLRQMLCMKTLIGFVAVRKHGEELKKLGICFVMPAGHTAILRFIMDDSVMSGLSRKLSEHRAWKKVSEADFDICPEGERRKKVIEKPGKKPYTVFLVKRKGSDVISPEERTFSEDIISTVSDFCFSKLGVIRAETILFFKEKLKGMLFSQAGFEKEGLLRSYLKFENNFYDMVLMSMLKPVAKEVEG